MHFKAKIDRFYIIFITISILILGLATILPIILDQDAPLLAQFIMIGLFIVLTTFILWITFTIEYVLLDEYLLVKGGPFRSRIRYATITRISRTKDMYSGYRLLTARNGLEIFYKTAILGSVKISPKKEQRFISELKKRCPNVKMDF
ncbi:PH domain-containing protein [Aquibacillus koreensis]|uniref:PH domain-containing protein n=1 Tax=Aquibacillus koreensis TaxID=279446 RepID=A0A9X4AJ88_9BACI|nr:PH domain-containing protein [Aquibacillus koreensis]MCT2536896.1 PH domain-containing protein [Aquibacillus koreensis]MDC3421972.1 PH domain-containing protein [Aquibacillus koreensis]